MTIKISFLYPCRNYILGFVKKYFDMSNCNIWLQRKKAPKKEVEFNQFYDEAFTIASYDQKTWII